MAELLKLAEVPIVSDISKIFGALTALKATGATDPTGFRPAAAADALGRYAAIRAAGGFPPPRGGRSAELGRVQKLMGSHAAWLQSFRAEVVAGSPKRA